MAVGMMQHHLQAFELQRTQRVEAGK